MDENKTPVEGEEVVPAAPMEDEGTEAEAPAAAPEAGEEEAA